MIGLNRLNRDSNSRNFDSCDTMHQTITSLTEPNSARKSARDTRLPNTSIGVHRCSAFARAEHEVARDSTTTVRFDTYAKRMRLTNFSQRISISQGRKRQRVERKLTRERSAGGPARRGAAEGGAILACFRDTKPSNDFESTRLVARIIQFEYVYGACGASGPRAHIRVPIGSSCNSRVYIQRVVLLAFSPFPSPLSSSRVHVI